MKIKRYDIVVHTQETIRFPDVKAETIDEAEQKVMELIRTLSAEVPAPDSKETRVMSVVIDEAVRDMPDYPEQEEKVS